MVALLNKKSLLTFYFTILRPCFATTYANMSGSVDAGVVSSNSSLATNTSLSTNSSIATNSSLDADKYSVAYVTVPSTDFGKTLAHGLVREKLAACVNIIPKIMSIYEWQGEVTEDSEALLMIKTRTAQVDKLTDYIRSNHPYEVCEVISLPIKNGNPPYLKWIGEKVAES